MAENVPTYSLAQARAEILNWPAMLANPDITAVCVMKHGAPSMAVISWDDYQSLKGALSALAKEKPAKAEKPKKAEKSATKKTVKKSTKAKSKKKSKKKKS